MTAPNAQGEKSMSIQSVGASSSQYAPAVQTASAGRCTEGNAEARAAPDSAGRRSGRQGRPPSSEELNQAVKQIQDVITKTANRLEFSIDEDLGVSIVKVVDTESKKLIRQIPSEEVLKIAKALDTLQGLLVKQQA
jgi:flagellar protein FlaG